MPSQPGTSTVPGTVTAKVSVATSPLKVTVGSSITAATVALNGNGTPIERGIAPNPGQLYVNNLDCTLWIAVLGTWRQLV